jgi:Fic family protein
VSTAIVPALDRLAALPGVEDAVAAARDACTELRWHPALRRRSAEARAEATIRAARCSAALDGARYPVDLVRDAARGARELPDDPAGLVARGALRAVTEAQHLEATVSRTPSQVLARLHVAAAAGVVPDDALGRPRTAGEAPGDGGGTPAPDGATLSARLASLGELLEAPASAPALVVAAVAHGEVATLRPFVAGNGVVARALARAVVVGRGLDPMGVVVWEAAHLNAGPRYATALAAYAAGTPDGVAHWLRHCAQAIVDGAGEGRAVCDAVLAGRLGDG